MKIAVLASDYGDTPARAAELADAYSNASPDDADVIIALGGDGFMLQTLHTYMAAEKPIFGINHGTVGFLMNEDRRGDALIDRIKAADEYILHPLTMTATKADGTTVSHLAINEVSLLRETRQTAKISISIDGRVRLAELAGDGILVATPAGSTAYNLSARGPILPLGCGLLALTPIAPFRPYRWRGALLPHASRVTLTMQESEKRPVLAVADMHEVRDVRKVEIEETRKIKLRLLFDRNHNLEERIFAEQFND